VARVLGDDHLLALVDGRTIGYATWGDPEGTTVFLGHGIPGSRLDRYSGLDDPEWVRRRRVCFVGVDRPGYGYSDPWPEAGLLDCARDLVRVADHLGLPWLVSGRAGAGGSSQPRAGSAARVVKRTGLL
jgi:pimeloyl-ACP methyl ester carboxylesterase